MKKLKYVGYAPLAHKIKVDTPWHCIVSIPISAIKGKPRIGDTVYVAKDGTLSSSILPLRDSKGRFMSRVKLRVINQTKREIILDIGKFRPL